MKYYSLKKILEYNATYNVIFGERSNGKTFSVLEHGIRQYWAGKGTLAVVRRWAEDIIGARGQNTFSALAAAGSVTKITKGEWTDVYYFARKWYLCKYDPETGKRITAEEPFAFGFCLSDQEHDKSTSYPTITTILFDEFLTRKMYMPDEFVIFMNVLSTIIRQRNDVKIFMLGNTVNKYCPYFKEMGLTHAKTMKEGTIDLYRYGDNELTVAVERTLPNRGGKHSDMYFAFDNPKLQMITGGTWEMNIYPHCPYKYRPKDILLKFFVIWDGETIQGNVIMNDSGESFLFFHEKTTEIREEKNDIIFSPNASMKYNHFTDILHTSNKTKISKLKDYIVNGKVFYSNNEVGEVIRNYLAWCASPHIIAK